MGQRREVKSADPRATKQSSGHHGQWASLVFRTVLSYCVFEDFVEGWGDLRLTPPQSTMARRLTDLGVGLNSSKVTSGSLPRVERPCSHAWFFPSMLLGPVLYADRRCALALVGRITFLQEVSRFFSEPLSILLPKNSETFCVRLLQESRPVRTKHTFYREKKIHLNEINCFLCLCISLAWFSRSKIVQEQL